MASNQIERLTGSVLWWNKDKGFGKIVGQNGIVYFFHYSESQKEKGKRLNFDSDEIVTFVPSQGQNGPRAVAVKASDDED